MSQGTGTTPGCPGSDLHESARGRLAARGSDGSGRTCERPEVAPGVREMWALPRQENRGRTGHSRRKESSAKTSTCESGKGQELEGHVTPAQQGQSGSRRLAMRVCGEAEVSPGSLRDTQEPRRKERIQSLCRNAGNSKEGVGNPGRLHGRETMGRNVRVRRACAVTTTT